MARTYSSPWRALGALAAIVLVVAGLIAGGVVWGKAQWTPKLALDLAGGTEFVLKARPAPGQEGSITTETMNEAVKIIRARVNGSGVSEAEVTTAGSDSIIVSLPGKNIDESTKDAIRRSAAMEFRAVIFLENPQPPAASASPSVSGSAAASATGSPSAAASASGAAEVKPAPSATSSGAGLKLATPSVSPTAEPSAQATPTASGAAASAAAASPSAVPTPTDGSDKAWLQQPGVLQAWQSTNCSTPDGLTAAQAKANDPTKPLVTCDQFGTKFVLGPVEVKGQDITTATAALSTNSQGQSTGQWVVNLEFNAQGTTAFGAVTTRLYALSPPENQFAIVLDNLVISAPTTNAVINSGRAEISGSFTQTSAQDLANQLKFGALPLSFDTATENDITATLGDQQLKRGLLAGLIGLILVVLYSLLQYRALGLVTVGSLLVAGLLTYLMVVLLGWRQGYRLSLAGIAGLIVAIGITADSFIVYFERIRDEVREGRSLTNAVELAWSRAKRTILISDAVSFLAAAVLYILAVGGVRGFAFTLGLTTLVDILVVFLFTKPVVTLLARTKFFGGGHRLSGFDAAHLGRQVGYTGRGRTRPPQRRGPNTRKSAEPDAAVGSGSLTSERPASSRTGGTIAERRAAAERATRGEEPAERRSRGGGAAVLEGSDLTTSSETPPRGGNEGNE